ncbi:MAG: hypothetical protein HFG91_05155 [Acholeplasmatales bacterium]|jgi:nicotinic acid phosphoribosyltransferase|nr:hypothetical protein [Acholeplasmatales bacterium]MCI9653724.1 hypothetical protein [Acholeplasmatales bacterium]
MAKIFETSEHATEVILQTHYYKTSYEKLKNCYLEALERLHIKVVSIDDNYLEIFAEQPHMAIQAKIIEQTPVETSIDFYINAEYIWGNKKKAYGFIQTMYEILEKNFELKGLSLHK